MRNDDRQLRRRARRDLDPYRDRAAWTDGVWHRRRHRDRRAAPRVLAGPQGPDRFWPTDPETMPLELQLRVRRGRS